MPRLGFDSLQRLPGRLYRGVNSATDREIFRVVGVGPVWRVVKALRDNPNLVLSDAALNALRTNLDRVNPVGNVAPPVEAASPLAALLASFEASAEILVNQLGSAEHVYWEEPIQTPTASRYLESTTRDPRIAILYAYGIDIASAMGGGPLIFFQGQPNQAPGVALLRAGTPDNLATAFQGAPHVQEVQRRIARDSEVLIHARVVTATTTDLPAFVVADKDGSLNAAAAALRQAGAAV